MKRENLPSSRVTSGKQQTLTLNGGGERERCGLFCFPKLPILGQSPPDFVANCRYSRGSQNQWRAEEQGTQRAKHNSHFYENQG